MKTIALALCLAFVAPACTEDKVILVTGDSLVALGDQFVATAGAMDKALETKAITPDAYGKWKVFGKKFQAAYPLAAHLWQVASEHQDATMAAQASAAVGQLALDLGSWAALAGVK